MKQKLELHWQVSIRLTDNLTEA